MKGPLGRRPESPHALPNGSARSQLARIPTHVRHHTAEKGIPLGCNVESVSLRKTEIEASVEMVQRVAKIMGRPLRTEG